MIFLLRITFKKEKSKPTQPETLQKGRDRREKNGRRGPKT
jgi:hypothetical protein